MCIIYMCNTATQCSILTTVFIQRSNCEHCEPLSYRDELEQLAFDPSCVGHSSHSINPSLSLFHTNQQSFVYAHNIPSGQARSGLEHGTRQPSKSNCWPLPEPVEVTNAQYCEAVDPDPDVEEVVVDGGLDEVVDVTPDVLIMYPAFVS